MTAKILIIIGSFSFFLVLFALLGSRFTRKSRRLKQRLARMIQPRPAIVDAEEEKTSSQTQVVPMSKKLLQRFSRQFAGKLFLQGWEKKLEQAAIPFTPEEFFIIRLFAGAVFAFLAYVFGQRLLVVSLAAFGVGYWLPDRYVKIRKEKRLRQFSLQLPNALGTMANAMRAGFSFLQSLKMIGQEMPDPIAVEMNRTLREMNLNIPVEDAFRNLLERLPNRDLELVVSALLVQRTTGGNLAELLESMQETLQERVRIQEELRTLTAQGRMSAWIITLLPVVLIGLIDMMNPAYFTPMLTSPIGWAMIGFAIVSGTLGWLVIRKIIRIEV
ncbi:type II secretion system F family protein [Fodinisporobacter ferrooxydans]|uniref:Type II secretion system F family protein n=1 Tax=Fodinisporobacter ferrooxydans TaxID=2901836 RepID=A0ABY4CLB7_9BACL|nr:type II secretion system F family protein [Alicyclobacillaceae bacterium MYW30-H2]